MKILNTQLPDSSAPLKDVILDAASQYNVSPSFLASSISPKEDEYSGDENYPVHGAEHFGIDSHDIPEHIDHDAGIAIVNGKQIPSANFRTVEDAAATKAYQLRNKLDNIKNVAQNRGVNINEQTAQFIAHAGDNGLKMLHGYANDGVLNDTLPEVKPEGYGAVYNNAKKGYDNAKALGEHFDPGSPIVTPAIMRRFNNFQDFVKEKGLAGDIRLDHDENLRKQLFDEFNSKNPSSALDPNMILPIQNEFQSYKQWVKDNVKRGGTEYEKGTNDENFMKDISKPDGIYGQFTSKWRFPHEYIKDKESKSKTDTGKLSVRQEPPTASR